MMKKLSQLKVEYFLINIMLLNDTKKILQQKNILGFQKFNELWILIDREVY